jgi:hypothetical protein
MPGKDVGAKRKEAERSVEGAADEEGRRDVGCNSASSRS